jgi:hypothetical protein
LGRYAPGLGAASGADHRKAEKLFPEQGLGVGICPTRDSRSTRSSRSSRRVPRIRHISPLTNHFSRLTGRAGARPKTC